MTNHKTINIINMPIKLWTEVKIAALRKGVSTHQYVIDLLKRAVKADEEDN